MVTLRACAGLNGMRLGSTILTVIQATPDAGTEVGFLLNMTRKSYLFILLICSICVSEADASHD